MRSALSLVIVAAALAASSASATNLKLASGSKPVILVLAADWHGDGIDELVLVRSNNRQQDRRLDLPVRVMPGRPGGRLGMTLASSVNRDLGDAIGDGRVERLGAADTDGDGRDDLRRVRRQHGASATTRIGSVERQLGVRLRSADPSRFARSQLQFPCNRSGNWLHARDDRAGRIAARGRDQQPGSLISTPSGTADLWLPDPAHNELYNNWFPIVGP